MKSKPTAYNGKILDNGNSEDELDDSMRRYGKEKLDEIWECTKPKLQSKIGTILIYGTKQ